MGDNADKLAWRGTPGPWTTEFENDCWYLMPMTQNWIVLNQSDKDDLYMASAAPEAVEFIADLMPIFELMKERNLFDKRDIDELISRGEEILKKAYNF